MSKKVKNEVWAGLIVLGFVAVTAVSCGKYDKMSILGEWAIDVKEAKGLGASVDSLKETLYFDSGEKYRETCKGVVDKVKEDWIITGTIERKNNKITFTDRIKNNDNKQPPVTYKYRIEGDKLILIVKDEGFISPKKDEKTYTKKK